MNPDSLPNGGPAFPCDPFIASKPGHESVAKRLAEGMTMRDYFASKALQGLCGSKAYAEAPYEVIAREAYQAADEMLKAREAK